MKGLNGTILHRGKKFKDKLIRALAWFRVKKYWLFMPKKEYKTNLFYNITGMVIWLIAAPMALYCFVVFKVIPAIEDYFNKKQEARKPE